MSNSNFLREILRELKNGRISCSEAERRITKEQSRKMAILSVGCIARLDVMRESRTSIPEAVLAEGKTPEQVSKIVIALVKRKGTALVTRLKGKAAKTVISVFRQKGLNAEYNPLAEACVVYDSRKANAARRKRTGKVGILTAGTADIRVAEEARMVVEHMNCRAVTAYDVGIAGVHRTVEALKKMAKEEVDVYIVAAGREGALPTLVAGLVNAPVIGVPVSIGYGMASGGQSALHAMLQACSPLVVVNIDAGFVAGAVAAQFVNRIARRMNTSKRT